MVAFLLVRARLRLPRVEPLVTQSGRTLSGFCAAAVQLHCNKRVECAQMDRAQLAACIEAIGAECERTVGWKLRAGILTTGGEPQDECFEAMAEAHCNALQFMLGDDEPGVFEITDRCEMRELFQPHSGLGGACAETSDCTAGFCPGLAPECHRCRPYVPPGGECRPGELACDPATGTCAAAPDGGMRCQPLAAEGARCGGSHECLSGACRGGADGGTERACGPGADGAPCADANDCGARYYCRLAAGRGSCAPRVKTGEPCAGEPRACEEVEARCVAGRCRVRPFLLADGAECRDFTDCKDGSYCKGTRGGAVAGRCTAQSDQGGACEPLDFGACRVDSTCAGGRCRRLRSAGERCSSGARCKAFLSCTPSAPDGGAGGEATCVPDAALGEPCGPSRQCVAGSCDAASGRCIPLAPGGAPCTTSTQCEWNWCVGRPGAAVCYAQCGGGPG